MAGSLLSGYGGSWGYCWIEQTSCGFTVYVLDGKSKIGPFSSYDAALAEFHKYVV